jgi:hypothetical protein
MIQQIAKAIVLGRVFVTKIATKNSPLLINI